MTGDEAKALGYEIVEASMIEWGLTKNGKGLRTWWKSQFAGARKPTLDDPEVQQAIRIHEEIGDYELPRRG